MAIVRIIDFETTGTEPPAEVCEVGYSDLDTETRAIAEPVSWLCGVKEVPPEVRAVHHISLADCAGQPAFDEFRLYDGPAVIAAHNADFERKFIRCTLPMICTYKAALRVWPEAPGHSNGTLRYWLEDQGLIKPRHKRRYILPCHGHSRPSCAAAMRTRKAIASHQALCCTAPSSVVG